MRVSAGWSPTLSSRAFARRGQARRSTLACTEVHYAPAVLRILLALALVLSTRIVRAEPTQTDAVIAQSLFDEGRNLLAAGKIKEACVKFAESQRLDPGGGTLLNLALCHEREGKIATASAELEAATAQAIKDGRKDREGIARDHFAALQPRLPKLVVEVRGATADE